MGLRNALRRFSRIPAPQVIGLPEDELAWPSVQARSFSIPTIPDPELSRDLVLVEPTIEEIRGLDAPELVSLDADVVLPPFEVYNLLDPLAPAELHGTIYIKQEDESLQRGKRVIRTRVVSQTERQAATRKEPKGLDIFEMLLPILMPPAVTEFRDELLFPQELYPFQQYGVKWLFENDSALLADDMGLGKTVQAITAFRALIRRSMALQALVICPKSVLANWMRELARWAPELVAVQIQGVQTSRRIAWRAFVGKCHVIVATYETIRQDRESIRGRVFDLVVADEVQRIKNPDAAVARAVRAVSTRRQWALTGTPLENKLEDIVAVFGFVKPGLFQASEVPALSVRAVRERVRPYLLRRRKEDLRDQLKLPQKVVDTKWLELTESQRRAYDRAELEGTNRLRANVDATVQHILALIQALKQICNFDPDTGESTKSEFLLEEYLPEACSDDQKALVFSQYVRTLDEVASRLGEHKPLIYKGELTTAQRTKVEEAFKSNDEHKVLLLSLRAGGVGLNLTRANYVLHFDRWWNPAVERQAEDRVHRFGQERMVFATRLICNDTIEERIEQLLERKRILFEEVVDELADVSLERVMSEEELFGLFGLTPPRRARQAVSEQKKIKEPVWPTT